MKLDRLSSTALKFLQKHELETISLETGPQGLNRNERSLIARMTLWLIKIDAQCSLLGCEASIIGYYQANPEILSCLQATSRLALQHNWGSEYPISQSIRDIESYLPMDMMMDILIIWYQIAQFYRGLQENNRTADISKLDRRLDFLEVKYQQVFYYGSSHMTLQPALKLNCAVVATMFYASRIYLKRSVSVFGTSGPPEIAHALSQLLVFAQLVCACATGLQQPVYEFQWSLFIAAIETNDNIHQEWLSSKISDARFQDVLRRIFAIKGSGTRGICIDDVSGMLSGEHMMSFNS
ncbi:Zn(II)2Cys6 transcription factor protein [Rutstroemia sp. NJR-2017a WRK4]|nr:Zn(II)2Cys6 transcription factor protein [Rutstroemia sp. NJR-2017a WRK4]